MVTSDGRYQITPLTLPKMKFENEKFEKKKAKKKKQKKK